MSVDISLEKEFISASTLPNVILYSVISSGIENHVHFGPVVRHVQVHPVDESNLIDKIFQVFGHSLHLWQNPALSAQFFLHSVPMPIIC